MEPQALLCCDALALTMAAAAMDVRQHRIPNLLTYSGMLTGLVLRPAALGWRGLAGAFAGLLAGGGVMLLFYLVRATAAGDVKLMAAVGSLLGARAALLVLIATAICGGVMALSYAICRRRLGTTVRNVGSLLQFHGAHGFQVHPGLNLDNPQGLRMPYGLAIAAGTLYACVATGWR